MLLLGIKSTLGSADFEAAPPRSSDIRIPSWNTSKEQQEQNLCVTISTSKRRPLPFRMGAGSVLASRARLCAGYFFATFHF